MHLIIILCSETLNSKLLDIERSPSKHTIRIKFWGLPKDFSRLQPSKSLHKI